MTNKSKRVIANQLPNSNDEQQSSNTSGGGQGVPSADVPGRIVVGVDGSPCCIDALRWADRQARLTGAAVEAVMSWDYPLSYGMEFGVLDVDWAANAESALRTALREAFGPDTGAITSRVVRGRPAEVLVAAAVGADLLVVGSRGHGAMAGMLLGSVSEYVVAHAPCPVLVIRSGEFGPVRTTESTAVPASDLLVASPPH